VSPSRRILSLLSAQNCPSPAERLSGTSMPSTRDISSSALLVTHPQRTRMQPQNESGGERLVNRMLQVQGTHVSAARKLRQWLKARYICEFTELDQAGSSCDDKSLLCSYIRHKHKKREAPRQARTVRLFLVQPRTRCLYLLIKTNRLIPRD
jgi:hypothetical protein